MAFDDDDGDVVASGSGERKASTGFAPLLRVREVALAGNKRLVDLETCLAAVACLPTLESLSFRDEHFPPAPVAEQPGYRERAGAETAAPAGAGRGGGDRRRAGAAADDRARARCLGDADSEREREAHEAKVAELREARDRPPPAAAAARARAPRAERGGEGDDARPRDGRAHAEEAARRREARRSVLRETLLRIGESHARASRTPSWRAARRRRAGRARASNESAGASSQVARRFRARERVPSLESDAASSRVSPTRRKDAFPLGAVLVEVREGVLNTPRSAATARAPPRGGREGGGRAAPWRKNKKKRGGRRRRRRARPLRVAPSSRADASSDASSKRATTSLDVGREKRNRGTDGLRRRRRGRGRRRGRLRVPRAVRRPRARGGGDALRARRVRAGRVRPRAPHARRGVRGAPNARSHPGRARPLGVGGAASAEEEALASELDGPAALLACEVRLTREEAVRGTRPLERRRRPGFDVERERIARCAFVVHAERARASDSDDGAPDADEDAKNTPRVFAARRARRVFAPDPARRPARLDHARRRRRSARAGGSPPTRRRASTCTMRGLRWTRDGARRWPRRTTSWRACGAAPLVRRASPISGARTTRRAVAEGDAFPVK